MTNLKDTLTNEMKAAMRAGDRRRRDTLRMVLAAIKQIEVDKRTSLDDNAVLGILQNEAKKRQETIADFEKAGRGDATDDLHSELAIVREYLPTAASEDELMSRAAEIIAEGGFGSRRDTGPVMKLMLAEFRGRADGKVINQIVRRLLSS